MEVKLASVLGSFEAAASRLNEESNSVNTLLAKIEGQLVSANAGIETWLTGQPLSSSDASGSTEGETAWTEQCLGFAKLNGKWCLAVKSIRVVSGFFEGDTNCPYTNKYVNNSPVPLAQAPRALRIAALELLPELIKQLTEETESATAQIRDSKVTFSK